MYLFLFLLGAICLNYTASGLNITKTYQGKCLNYGIDRLSFLQDSTRKFVHLINKDQPVGKTNEMFLKEMLFIVLIIIYLNNYW